jgi:heme exporter protein D
MVELGKYAFPVLASYGVTIVLLAGLVALTLWRAAKVRRALAEAERDA